MLGSLRQDLRILLTAGLILAGLSFAIGYVTDTPLTIVNVQPTFLEERRLAPKTQHTKNRILKEYTFQRMVIIDSTRIAKPIIMRADITDNIYILDWADLRIKLFSPTGSLLNIFGEVKGSPLSRLLNPTGFSVGLNGELWVCDPPQRRIIQITPKGTVAQTLIPKSAVDRITVVGDTLITMAPPGAKFLFELYSLSGRFLKSFGEFIEDQPEYGIVLDGELVGDNQAQQFIYGGRYTGILAGYSLDGEQRFIARTIKTASLPKVLIIDGRKKVEPSSTIAILSMNIVDDRLYVLSGSSMRAVEKGQGQIVDVYNKFNGTYLFSFQLPVACRQAIIRSDRVYTLTESEVTVWRFEPKT